MNDTIDASPEAALGRAIGANVLACELIGVLLSIGQNDLVDQAVRQATALSGSSYSGGENLDADKIGEFAR
ncbi:hypothetical protein, partial [Aeromonas veronii]|uniref:hypothetical protein n=1 Tax=Aeromonas veronii TaxID=654 RepID=UPI00406CCC1A